MIRYTVAIVALIASAGLSYGQTVMNWTGPYVGLATGLAAAHDDINVAAFGTTVNNPFDLNAVQFGGFAGYNWQGKQVVYGLEAALKFGNLNATGLINNGDFFNTGWNDKLGLNGSLHARIGIPYNRALFYFAAGPSFLTQQVVNDCLTCGGAAFIPLNWKNTRLGAEFGVGIDFAATDKLILRVEYLHGEYGTIQLANDGTYNVTSALQTNAITIGASYKF